MSHLVAHKESCRPILQTSIHNAAQDADAEETEKEGTESLRRA